MHFLILLLLFSFTEDGDEIRHAWYQWVCFVLFFQAVLCYFPHYLWKSWEGERERERKTDKQAETKEDST
jgi:hypothetical protein